MVEIICKYCGERTIAKRKSKLTCDKEECKDKLNNERVKKYYNKHPDKQDNNRFRASKNQLKRRNHGWNQINREIITDRQVHISMRKHVCENCNFEYMAGGGKNYTSWNAAFCPECGLVEKSIIDTDPWEYHLKYQPQPATQEEINECKQELRKVKHYPILKKLAIYIDIQKTIIDFPQELIELRKLLNRLKERNDKKQLSVTTTPEEEQICFAALNKKILENKNIINK